MKRLVNKDNVINILFIFLGSFLMAVGTNMFLVHANLLTGGVTGIALIIEYLVKFPSGITVFILNIPLLFLSYKKLNSKFTVFTILGTIFFSVCLLITSPFTDYIRSNDMLMLCLVGGVIDGIGFAIVLCNYGSTGGLDIICMLIKKRYEHFNIGQVTFAFNFVIVLLNIQLFSLESALYTLISMYVSAIATDKFINGFNKRTVLYIITNKEKEVSDYILNRLNRGVTYLYGEGAYTGETKKILFCTVLESELPKLKRKVKQLDKESFILIVEASEVKGNGFHAPF